MEEIKSQISKLQSSAKVGQEAHRQIQKVLRTEGARTEVTKVLRNSKVVRKDGVRPDGTNIIIKPNTKS